MSNHTYSSGDRVLSSETRYLQRSVACPEQFLTSVVTRLRFDVPAEAVWKRLMFYEAIERRPPWILRLLLPIPVRAEGKATEVGDEVKCWYQNGYLLKRVTQITRGQSYAFDVVEQRLALPRGIRLSQGSYLLRELPQAGTEVFLETRYLSTNRPRWLCQRIEAMVCHLFHSHILRAMGDDIFSSENKRETK